MKTKRDSICSVNLKVLTVLTVLAVFAAITTVAYSNGGTKTSGIFSTSFTMVTRITDSIYTEVDVMPKFKNDDQGVLDFITRNIAYPPEAKKSGIQGKVIVKFVVRMDGTVTNPEILKGAGALLDAEALRVVGNLPKFDKPGMKAGKIVNTYYMVPITFALK